MSFSPLAESPGAQGPARTSAGAPAPRSVLDADARTRLLDLLPLIGDATDPPALQFREAVTLLGANAGVFLSSIRLGHARTGHRSLLACDHRWGWEYAQRGWWDRDPWLRHAYRRTEPIHADALVLSPAERDFVAAAQSLGFASALIVPAHTNAGASLVGVLSLGSHDPTVFHGEIDARLRVLARALAAELLRWQQRAMRDDLIATARITPADIELLMHEEAGHSSKVIAAALGIEVSAVDCRFRRLNHRLGAPDRRHAAHIAKLFGLI